MEDKPIPLTQQIVLSLSEETLLEIESLAEKNLAPSDIAVRMGFNKKAFLRLWRDETTEIYQAYYRGRLNIEIARNNALNQKIRDDQSVTAIQIQKKIADELEFENIKKSIFEL